MTIRSGCRVLALVSCLLGPLAAGCAVENAEDDARSVEAEVGERVVGPVAKTTDAEVWSATNRWSDTSTPDAKKAGVAWGENSGLTWEAKYARWVGAMEIVDPAPQAPDSPGYGKTLRMKTPFGRVVDGPRLECADFAMFLRATFASWYRLPFMMVGWADGRRVFFGHFGVVDDNGDPVAAFTRFGEKRDGKLVRPDYTATWRAGAPWPTDAVLAARSVDGQSENAEWRNDRAYGLTVRDGGGRILKTLESGWAGAYYDQIFLNKRVGHFLVLMDAMFGSVNLADGNNMFHVKPEAIAAGDVLVERMAREGIGHTIPIFRVDRQGSGDALKLRATVASGSMPRRQPLVEDPASAFRYFVMDATGGAGNGYDGVPYAKLGGGLRRWRTSGLVNGRWSNVVLASNKPSWIDDQDLDAIAARPARFAVLMGDADPETARATLLSAIETKRELIRQNPSNCNLRWYREQAFEPLYKLMERSFHKTRPQVDAEYRTLEDYVFHDMQYEKSRVCCWNGAGPGMTEIAIAYAEKEREEAKAAQVCKAPTPFAWQKGTGFGAWRAFAMATGRADKFQAWRADSDCRAAVQAGDGDPLDHATEKPYCDVPREP